MSSEAARVDLVITAPAPYAEEFAYATRARSTLGVLTQLVAGAKEHVVLAAPFMQAQAVFELGVLAQALKSTLKRGAVIDLMTTRENLQLPVLQRLSRSHAERLRLFAPAFPSSAPSELGSHAKFCIQDEAAAYVGSANLTVPALGGGDSGVRRHFEMGLLVTGQAARSLAAFWRYAVHFGIFTQAS